MSIQPVIYVTTNLAPGEWGPGVGRLLTPAEIDGNFWWLVTQVTQLQNDQQALVSISYFTIIGNQLTIHMTDHTTRGPITVPTAVWEFRDDVGSPPGTWAPLTNYAAFDVFTFNGVVYLVETAHVSGTTFDPHATDGQGHELYDAMLSLPELTLPTGGSKGAVLTKASGVDFDMLWSIPLLSGLFDVEMVSPVDGNDYLVFDTTLNRWTNKELTLIPPTLSTLGGVFQKNQVSHQFAYGIDSSGNLLVAQPFRVDVTDTLETLGSHGTVTLDPTLGHTWDTTPT